VPHATSLRWLRIEVADRLADTLDQVAVSSSLKHLAVEFGNPVSDETVVRIITQLRTNTTLTSLSLTQPTFRPWMDRPELFRPIASVLDTYNFTLKTVELAPSLAGSAVVLRINDLLRRNRRIRRALQRLLQPRGCRASPPPTLLPEALGTVSSFPTLLYRFLRKGDLTKLSDLLLFRR
jgi:hypothetical protein